MAGGWSSRWSEPPQAAFRRQNQHRSHSQGKMPVSSEGTEAWGEGLAVKVSQHLLVPRCDGDRLPGCALRQAAPRAEGAPSPRTDAPPGLTRGPREDRRPPGGAAWGGRGRWTALSSAPGAVWRPSALPSARGREVGAAGAALAELLPEQRGCWRPRSGAEGGKRCPQASAEPFLGAWGRSRGCRARWAAAGGSGCAPSSRRWTRGLRGWGTSGERRSLTNNRSLVCACQIAYKAQELSSGALLFIPVQSPDVYSLLSLETLLAQLCISVPTSYPLDDNLIAFHQWFKLLLIGNRWNHTWKCFTGKTWFKTDTCDNFDFVGSWHAREISEQAS